MNINEIEYFNNSQLGTKENPISSELINNIKMEEDYMGDGGLIINLNSENENELLNAPGSERDSCGFLISEIWMLDKNNEFTIDINRTGLQNGMDYRRYNYHVLSSWIEAWNKAIPLFDKIDEEKKLSIIKIIIEYRTLNISFFIEYVDKVKKFISGFDDEAKKKIRESLEYKNAEAFLNSKDSIFNLPTRETYKALFDSFGPSNEMHNYLEMRNYLEYDTLESLWEKNKSSKDQYLQDIVYFDPINETIVRTEPIISNNPDVSKYNSNNLDEFSDLELFFENYCKEANKYSINETWISHLDLKEIIKKNIENSDKRPFWQPLGALWRSGLGLKKIPQYFKLNDIQKKLFFKKFDEICTKCIGKVEYYDGNCPRKIHVLQKNFNDECEEEECSILKNLDISSCEESKYWWNEKRDIENEIDFLCNPKVESPQEESEVIQEGNQELGNFSKALALGWRAYKINIALAVIIFPLCIAICFLKIFKENDLGQRIFLSLLVGACVLGPIIWVILAKINNNYHFKQIAALK
jgi:hypothetical protein